MATYSNSAREVEMPNGDVVVLHSAPTGGANTTSNIKKFKYDDNGHVTESTAANATDLNLNSYSTPTTGSTAIGTSDAVQTAIGKLDHQSQIDQSNILYAINTGVKNALVIKDRESDGAGTIHFSAKNGIVTVTGTNGSNTSFFTINFTGISGRFKLNGCPSGGSDNTYLQRIYTADGSIAIGIDRGSGTAEFTLDPNVEYQWTIRINANYAIQNSLVFRPMLYQADTDGSVFQTGALPNYDLTRLEAEDRASLAEVVDSGAKNELQPTWTTQEINGVKFTVGSDGVITATTTGTRTSAAIYPLLSRYSGTKMTGKVMSISPKGGTNASYYVAAEQADSPWHNVGTDYGDGVVISSEANNKDINVNIVIPANYSPNNLKFQPMICTKAAFGVSQKFVPYKTTFDNNMIKVATWITSFSIPATTRTIKYLYVRGGNPTKMGVYLLANTGIITEVVAFSYGTFTITYNSTNNSFDCTSSVTVEAYLQTYPIP